MNQLPKNKLPTTEIHPDDFSLYGYLNNPDSDRNGEISLHLAVCSFCREQVNTMGRLLDTAAEIQSAVCNEQQQQMLDDLLNGQLSVNKIESLRLQVKDDPVLLKSALFSLSGQATFEKSEQMVKTEQKRDFFANFKPEKLLTKIINWLSVKPTRLVFPLTAVATLLLVVVLFQSQVLTGNPGRDITISSFQDNNNIRFIPQNNMPGLGFFSSSNQYTEPYKNMSIRLKERNRLELEWQAVEKAGLYHLTINRYSEGHKLQHDKLTTAQTRTNINLTENDFNQRFEWVLSGKTAESKSFITSGGFVINRKLNK